MDLDDDVKREPQTSEDPSTPNSPTKARARKTDSFVDNTKRRCVSTACIACRRRKSKCDGNTPACAACSSVYGTPCVYDPNSDHRRKGVYKKDIDNLKTRNSTLQVIVQAILNYSEEDVPELIRNIRTCESLDKVAESINTREQGLDEPELDNSSTGTNSIGVNSPTFESQLSSKMGELRMDAGSRRYIGATSNLIYLGSSEQSEEDGDPYLQQKDPVTSWTTVTRNPETIMHLLNMYFTWHYTFFTTLSKDLFFRDFMMGKPPQSSSIRRKTEYCTPLLVNAMLALGCHFTSHAGAREDPDDSDTAGDHFFKEAKRLLVVDDAYEKPNLATVQALALMSVREAGCGRESKGWVYSGISFRMACDLGLNYKSGSQHASLSEEEEDARRVTFWGCFLFDKCWSNYLGRLPMFVTKTNITVPKFDVFPDEDADTWSPYTDSGFTTTHAQPSRTRAVALQISALCDISSDVMKHFYHPQHTESPPGKQTELKSLGELQTRLEKWRTELPKEMEPREGGLSSVLVMHMFAQLLYIHLFRPFLKYNQATSPLPANVSPRKLCTQAAATISKLLRLYKRSYGLRQICNLAVYIAHSACTIHLLNLPDKNAKRDITHGVKHLEEIAQGWPCARRTLTVLSVQARKWRVSLPDEAAVVLLRTDSKFGRLSPVPRSPEETMSSHQHTPALQSAVQGGTGRTAVWTQQQLQQQQPQQQQIFYGADTNVYNMMQATSQQQRSMAPPPRSMSVMSSSPNAAKRSSSTFHAAEAQYMSPTVQYAMSHSSGASPIIIPQQQHQQRKQQQHQQRKQHPFQPKQPLPPSRNTTANILTLTPTTTNTTTPTTTTPLAIPPPSDMFGGVESLLKEGQDWWVRDQSQVASGFNNWGLYESTGLAGIGPNVSSAAAATNNSSINVNANANLNLNTLNLNGPWSPAAARQQNQLRAGGGAKGMGMGMGMALGAPRHVVNANSAKNLAATPTPTPTSTLSQSSPSTTTTTTTMAGYTTNVDGEGDGSNAYGAFADYNEDEWYQ